MPIMVSNGGAVFRLFLLLLFVTSLLAGGEAANPGTFKTRAFAIKLTEAWDRSPQERGATVLFYTLPERGPQACLIIGVQKVSEPEPSSLVQVTKAAIEEEFPEVSFLLEREIKQDGALWTELIYTYSGMEFLQVMTVRGGYGYIFTATVQQELFKSRLPEFRQIFHTWLLR